MIDLHTHSTASDGTFSPRDLLYYAKEQGLSVLALTDHDTIDGIDEAREAAMDLDICFIPGVELNINWPTGEFHLLGLGLQENFDALQEELVLLQESRMNRNKDIIDLMQKAGFPIDFDTVSEMFETNSLGRPHIAQYLVSIKKAKNVQDAFDRYIGKGRPFYIGRKGLDLDRAIEVIKETKGVPVLAHPMSLYVSWGKLGPVLHDLHERGIEGLEAWHPGARMSECQRLDELGRKLGFFITAGSDFHGPGVRKDRKLGHSCRMKKIDEKYWTEELKPHLE